MYSEWNLCHMGLEVGREGSGEDILLCSLLCGLNFYDLIDLMYNIKQKHQGHLELAVFSLR